MTTEPVDPKVQRGRIAAKAQGRAHRRLAKEFPTIYRQYYLEAKAQCQKEARK